MNKRDNYSEVLHPADLQRFLGIGRDKAYALMRSKAFPAIRIGKQYIVTKEALADWLETNKYKEYAV